MSTDQADRADDDDKDHGEHDCVFRNVLAFLAGPKGTWVAKKPVPMVTLQFSSDFAVADGGELVLVTGT